jgi:hypothetical protein
MQITVIKLIIARLFREFSRQKLLPFLVGFLLFSVLILIMFLLSDFVCWFDRVLGYPTVKPPGYRNPPWAYFRANCDEAVEPR